MSLTEAKTLPIVVALDRLALLLMLLVLAGILSAAMVMQYAFGELPCPLCLLQRLAMFGCCFGVMRQLSDGNSERGGGIGVVFAILLLVISVRQTLLDLFPRPGHDYVGSAVFGMHMQVWSVVIAVALLLGFGIRLALFGGPRAAPKTDGALIRRSGRALGFYVLVICTINVVSIIVQCGLAACHTSGYALLS